MFLSSGEARGKDQKPLLFLLENVMRHVGKTRLKNDDRIENKSLKNSLRALMFCTHRRWYLEVKLSESESIANSHSSNSKLSKAVKIALKSSREATREFICILRNRMFRNPFCTKVLEQATYTNKVTSVTTEVDKFYPSEFGVQIMSASHIWKKQGGHACALDPGQFRSPQGVLGFWRHHFTKYRKLL